MLASAREAILRERRRRQREAAASEGDGEGEGDETQQQEQQQQQRQRRRAKDEDEDESGGGGARRWLSCFEAALAAPGAAPAQPALLAWVARQLGAGMRDG